MIRCGFRNLRNLVFRLDRKKGLTGKRYSHTQTEGDGLQVAVAGVAVAVEAAAAVAGDEVREGSRDRKRAVHFLAANPPVH